MLDTVRLEHEALRNADLKGVEEATRTKEAVIAAIRQQESHRLRQVTALALEWRRPLRELTLTEIILVIQGRDPQGADLMRSSFNALTVLVQRVRDQNEINRRLVETSLEHIGAMKKNVLGEACRKTETYTQTGRRSSGTGESRLISKEA
jgi:flagellar biosynthesis/type III secretory pathway chaperone